MLLRASLLVLLGSMVAFPFQPGTTLNLSHDLVPLGIAGQNLIPNTPSLDAGPLFQAAVQYVQNSPVQLLTVDPGSYYFLTPQFPSVYLVFEALSDLTVDLQGSALYFNDGLLSDIAVDDCQRFTLKNFTVDSLVPRFTQLQLTAVDPAQLALTYVPLPGWADPATFTPSLYGNPELAALIYRNGEILPGTGVMFVNYPVTGNALTLYQNGSPWTQSSALSAFKPGDTLLVVDQSGGTPISADNGDSLTISNIEVHGTGGGFAVQVGQSSNSTVENVRVTPRQGALVSSNADGIHFTESLRNNHIRHCYVTRTFDDALAMDSEYLATVVSQPGPRQLIVMRESFVHFFSGALVNFLHPATAAEVAGAIIVSEDPPDSLNLGQYDQVTLTFDRDLPPVMAGDGMIYGAADMRGGGSSIEDNTVVEGIGRGVFLGGLEDVVVQRNVIRSTASAGINVHQWTVDGSSAVPSHGIAIQSNSIESVLGPELSGATGAYINQAAIIVASSDPNLDFIPTQVNSNISIVNNYIADSGRSGIWIGELNYGEVSNNVIVRWNQRPDLPVWGDVQAFPQDFAQPLAMRFSQNVNTSNNVTQATSSSTGPVNLTPSSVSPGAAPSAGSIAVHANVPDFSWIAISDSDWLTTTEGDSGAGDGTLQYEVAENTSRSPRSGSITIAGVVFTVSQSAQ
jgi:hypothetical protein